MKLTIILTLFILAYNSLDAQESITAQLEAIQYAPREQRVKMVNNLKIQIAKMNEVERIKTIELMKQKAYQSTVMKQQIDTNQKNIQKVNSFNKNFRSNSLGFTHQKTQGQK